jgi:hypothetical protein
LTLALQRAPEKERAHDAVARRDASAPFACPVVGRPPVGDDVPKKPMVAMTRIGM